MNAYPKPDQQDIAADRQIWNQLGDRRAEALRQFIVELASELASS